MANFLNWQEENNTIYRKICMPTLIVLDIVSQFYDKTQFESVVVIGAYKIKFLSSIEEYLFSKPLSLFMLIQIVCQLIVEIDLLRLICN